MTDEQKPNGGLKVEDGGGEEQVKATRLVAEIPATSVALVIVYDPATKAVQLQPIHTVVEDFDTMSSMLSWAKAIVDRSFIRRSFGLLYPGEQPQINPTEAAQAEAKRLGLDPEGIGRIVT